MGTQWARAEIKKNELAAAVERASLWVQTHQQSTLWSALGLAGLVLLGVGLANRVWGEREESWSRFAVIQSYAYGGHPDSAIEQAQRLAEEYPSSAAASYALLLAGDILYDQQKFAEAAKLFERVAAQPNQPEALPLALGSLASAKEASGDCTGAAQSSQAFLDAHADHYLAPPTHAVLARCLAASGQAEKARQTYERMGFLYQNSYWAEWAKERTKA